MAGGVGSRLYPLSTPEKPKQFLDLLGVGKSLIRLTYERFLEVDPSAHFWVVTSKAYYGHVREQLPEVPDEQILLEPVARNTAPCIAYVSWKIARRYPGARVLVSPSDAYVPDAAAFARTSRAALDFVGTPNRVWGEGGVMYDADRASSAPVVTFGIAPDHPDTEYGYIHAVGSGDGILKVSAFKEKPSLEVAERYLAEGGYYWNAGIFVYGVQTMIDALRAYVPDIAAIMDRLAPTLYTPSEQPALEELFPQCEKISIDYAVMERYPHVFVAPASWAWSDLGSFAAIEKVTGKKLQF